MDRLRLRIVVVHVVRGCALVMRVVAHHLLLLARWVTRRLCGTCCSRCPIVYDIDLVAHDNACVGVLWLAGGCDLGCRARLNRLILGQLVTLALLLTRLRSDG